MKWRWAVVCLALLMPSGAGAQFVSSIDCKALGRGRLGAYLSLVELYRSSSDEAVAELRGLPRSTMVESVRSLGGGKKQKGSLGLRLPDVCLRAAALLHTEAAFAAITRSDYVEAELQIGLARLQVERIGNRETQASFQRDWLLALAYLYQQFLTPTRIAASYPAARAYFDEAVRLFPTDAEVLTSAGALYEWNGSLLFGDRNDLDRAEKLYRQAVVSDPALAEAQLRLGRVLEKRGDDEAAREPLERALALHESLPLDGLAHLFLGRLDERDEKLASAMKHYRAATRVTPRWQVGYFALAHALHASGNRRDSRELMEKALTLPELTAGDGWWRYERGRSDRLGGLLERLRIAVSP